MSIPSSSKIQPKYRNLSPWNFSCFFYTLHILISLFSIINTQKKNNEPFIFHFLLMKLNTCNKPEQLMFLYNYHNNNFILLVTINDNIHQLINFPKMFLWLALNMFHFPNFFHFNFFMVLPHSHPHNLQVSLLFIQYAYIIMFFPILTP
jgi:hypothetical protein